MIVTNCSNNYGPYQFPEKLIPVVITKALRKEKIPVYGKGENVRDWLFVEDHVQALFRACTQGNPGETYNVGGSSECTNLLLVKKICALLDQIVENAPAGGFGSLISFVTDRPGHDHRYAIDASKIERELGWKPSVSLDAGLKLTIEWYLKNQEWCERVASGKYRQERLGLRREGESFLLR
ncbi:MAG: dTDP-glucose 4,6-dehydratase [Verrucomicrobiales bacterium]|nr:dTDP-glucose 4,6-dehydratase [Verrucomicrobiales bacterium]